MATGLQRADAILTNLADPIVLTDAQKLKNVDNAVVQATDVNIIRAVGTNTPLVLAPGVTFDIAAFLALPIAQQILPTGVSVDRASLTANQRSLVFCHRLRVYVRTMGQQVKVEAAKAAAAAAETTAATDADTETGMA